MKIKSYTQEIEAQMLNFYNSLSEKDRRRYAAIEATKLGYGGDTYIRRILHCDDRTIARGKRELKVSISDEGPRIRKQGGGRKFVIDAMEGLSEAFLNVLKKKVTEQSKNIPFILQKKTLLDNRLYM